MPPPSKKSKTSHSKPKPVEQSKAAVELGGDDLDDNLLLDDSYLSPNEDQEPSPPADDDVEAYLSPDESALSKKRPASTNEPPSAESKKLKKDKKKLQSKQKKTAKLEELGLLGGTAEEEGGGMDDTAILPLEVVLDRFSEKQSKVLKDLSSLELDEVRVNRE